MKHSGFEQRLVLTNEFSVHCAKFLPNQKITVKELLTQSNSFRIIYFLASIGLDRFDMIQFQFDVVEFEPLVAILND